MSAIDEILALVGANANSRFPEIIGNVFDTIEHSMDGVQSFSEYINLKRDLNFIRHMHYAIVNDTYDAQNDLLVYKYIQLSNNKEVNEKKAKLRKLKNNSKGIRKLRKEILQTLDNLN